MHIRVIRRGASAIVRLIEQLVHHKLRRMEQNTVGHVARIGVANLHHRCLNQRIFERLRNHVSPQPSRPVIAKRIVERVDFYGHRDDPHVGPHATARRRWSHNANVAWSEVHLQGLRRGFLAQKTTATNAQKNKESRNDRNFARVALVTRVIDHDSSVLVHLKAVNVSSQRRQLGIHNVVWWYRHKRSHFSSCLIHKKAGMHHIIARLG